MSTGEGKIITTNGSTNQIRIYKNPKRHLSAVFVLTTPAKLWIFKENGELRFPGGSPKSTETFLETLHREIEEEANVLLQNPHLIDGFKVQKANSQQPWFIQMFYIADIKKILTPQIDPESGQIHQRIFIDPADLPKYLRWGKTGDQLFTAALKKYHQLHPNNS